MRYGICMLLIAFDGWTKDGVTYAEDDESGYGLNLERLCDVRLGLCLDLAGERRGTDARRMARQVRTWVRNGGARWTERTCRTRTSGYFFASSTTTSFICLHGAAHGAQKLMSETRLRSSESKF